MENKCWKGREMEHTYLERWTCTSAKWVIPRHEWSSRYWIAHGRKRLSMYLSSKLSKILMKAKKNRGAFLFFFSFLFIFLFLFFSSFFFFFFFSLFYSSFFLLLRTFRELRTMCGSRTGGWSLPCVMSDWQCCVDWFLAKYCRCRFQLD
jgi:hypothetical protein